MWMICEHDEVEGVFEDLKPGVGLLLAQLDLLQPGVIVHVLAEDVQFCRVVQQLRVQTEGDQSLTQPNGHEHARDDHIEHQGELRMDLVAQHLVYYHGGIATQSGRSGADREHIQQLRLMLLMLHNVFEEIAQAKPDQHGVHDRGQT